MKRTLLLLLALAATPLLLADGPGDNIPEKVRPIPPKGIAVPAEARTALKEGLAELGEEIAKLPAALKGKPALLDLLPDVEIFHRAVRVALEHDEFFNPADVKDTAPRLLQLGLTRARELKAGKPAWPTATGLVVRGYRSRIDGTAQPYGLVVPPSYRADGAHHHRLDVWLHGRGETLSEVSFLGDRLRSPGQFTPRDAFVLHPYGRYCNANKFAGEVDVLEALTHARRHYPIDGDRLVLRGFSMGGAGCWQIAAHYPSWWAAAAPGAGFSETTEFLRVFQKEVITPTPTERALLQMFDCPPYAVNFFNLPTVAYSGEKDSQKQAADVMEKALADRQIDLVHVIGPGTGHSYHPAARLEVDRRIDALAARGRDRVPPRVRFTTPTLRYNRSFWVTVDGLAEHWKPGEVDAQLDRRLTVKTNGVTGLTLSFGTGDCPLTLAPTPEVVLDGQTLAGVPRVRSDRSWSASFRKVGNAWEVLRPAAQGAGLVKRHGSQGPIDDAFLDSFLIVRPTGQGFHEATGRWATGEMNRAITEWRRQFRGDARVKADKEVTDADIASHNLILWGDPSSNAVLKKLVDRLPLKWDAKSLTLGKGSHDASQCVPLLVYPNPLNPNRYVVLNSGFTYREYDYLNNARQVPKLPDWAVIDVRTPPSPRTPGKVVAVDFFDEAWQVK